MFRRLLTIAFLAFAISPALAETQQIRLTLQQGVPVTDADIAGALSVCLEPYKSPQNQLTTFNGASWVPMTVAPSTYCLSAAGLSPNLNYDVLVTSASGLPALSWSPAYVDDTHPPARALQNGIEVAASDNTKLVIGAVHVNSIGQLEDNHTHRWLSNYYSPEPREMWVQDPATTWNNATTPQYTNATAYQQAHGNAANQLDYIAVEPRRIVVSVNATVIAGSSAGGGYFLGIGLDGSLGDVSNCGKQQASIPGSLSSVSFQTSVCYIGTPGVGRHTALWLEHIYSGAVPTWLGSIPPSQISGISGLVMN